VPGGAPGQAPNNQKAVIALVLGVIGLVFAVCCSVLGILLGIGAAILGYLSKQEIAQSNGTQGGANLAQWGFVTGLVAIGLGIVMLILSFAMDFGAGISNFGP
jgi:uncharacterized membrane protein